MLHVTNASIIMYSVTANAIDDSSWEWHVYFKQGTVGDVHLNKENFNVVTYAGYV